MVASELFPKPKPFPLRLPHISSSSTASLLCPGSLRRHHQAHRRSPAPSQRPFRSTSRVGAVRSSWNPEFEGPSTEAAMPSGGVEGVAEDGFLASGESELPVELCVTRTFPPALTLAEAVGILREEVAKLRENPPCAGSGVLRLQVAVPPSIKPLNWLFSQCRSLEAFPQFSFARSSTDGSGLVSLPDGMVGISGTGAAVYIDGLSSCTSRAKTLTRYLSVDSPLIELNEFESCSVLASTLVWDDSLSYTFDKAVKAVELKLCKIVCHVPVVSKLCHENWYHYIHGLSSLMEMKDAEMECKAW